VSFTVEAQLTKADHVIILRNPHAGARDSRADVERLTHLIQAEGFQAEVFTDLTSAAASANVLVDQGRLRVLVGVGGDGTAAELANRTKPGTPLTWLPRGNSNLIARHLHLESSPEHLAETISRGTLIRLDAGKAGDRVFLIMASCGLDAEVVRQVHALRTGHMSSRHYFKPLWEVLRTFEYPELRVYCDEALHDASDGACLRARWFSVFNLPCYGGRLRLAPHAVGNDGRLDLCGFKRGNLWNFMRYVGAVYLGQHRCMADWITRSVRRVRIVSDAPVPYQLDGDPGGWLPLDIEVLPQRLTMLVPKQPSTRYHKD
jgi:diacylglycerol kinase (ATP)